MKTNIIKLIILSLFLSLSSCGKDDDNAEKENDKQLIESCKKSTTRSANFNPEQKAREKELLDLINNYRKQGGKNELKILDKIKLKTDQHTDFMICMGKENHLHSGERFECFFEDLRNELKEELRYGENVARGTVEAKEVFEAWTKSPSHNANLLGDFTHFNITAKSNMEIIDGKKREMWYYTNIFLKIN